MRLFEHPLSCSALFLVQVLIVPSVLLLRILNAFSVSIQQLFFRQKLYQVPLWNVNNHERLKNLQEQKLFFNNNQAS